MEQAKIGELVNWYASCFLPCRPRLFSALEHYFTLWCPNELLQPCFGGKGI